MGLLGSLRASFRKSKGASETRKLQKFQDIIGYHFRDETILQLSLTHRSYSHLNDNHSPANERLEFLGDSVLGMVVAHQLYVDHPDYREGDLTKIKALLVNEVTLASVGKKIGLNSFIRLSQEEEKAGGRERPSIISDALESVIAAVFLDGGIDAARDVILRLLYTEKESVVTDTTQRNYKGELLELTQARNQGMPRYDVVNESGPDHEKVFDVDVYVNGTIIGSGRGTSKKEAEQKAASQALSHYGNTS